LSRRFQVIGVTDYYITDSYEECLKHKAAGRLPEVPLLFPNIELRPDIAAKSGFVNLHLLVCPENPDHLAEVWRILKRLPEPSQAGFTLVSQFGDAERY
jgi:hypothetical protein